MSMKNSSDIIGNRTHDLSSCSAVPQPTASPCVPEAPFMLSVKLCDFIPSYLCCARDHSVQFSVQFFYTVKLHSLNESLWGP